MRRVITGIIVGGLTVAGLLRLCRKKKKVSLKGKEKIALPLTSVEVINHDTRIFTFDLPSEQEALGVPVGKHVSLSSRIDGKLCVRAYTPVSSDHDLGVVKLAIKVYEDGKMTQHLERMAIGDTVEFSGPKGEFEYFGRGEYHISKRGYPGKGRVKQFAMIAGGSGITPILQVIEAIHRDPSDTTIVHLIFCNRTVEDILLRDRLEAIQASRPEQFRFWFTVSEAPADWQQGVGRLTQEMVSEKLGSSADSMALMCGPPLMLKNCCHPFLELAGFEKHQRFAF